VMVHGVSFLLVRLSGDALPTRKNMT